MTTTTIRWLDLADIQGNIVRPYGRFGFPVARHLFFNIANPVAGRRFVESIRHAVTTAERWDGDGTFPAAAKPLVAMNVGFSFYGLLALALPTRTLSRLPDEFIDGMAKRSSILGDVGPSAPKNWDPIWVNSASGPQQRVHIWVSLNAQLGPDGNPVGALQDRTNWLAAVAAGSDGVTLLAGHNGADRDFQESSALMELHEGRKIPTAREHFGFTDGIGDPVFVDQYTPDVEAQQVIGGGTIMPGNRGWEPLATGEFILGHVNEAQELPPAAPPWSFTRNGTFMAYRKLHQNVQSFRQYIDQQALLFQQVGGASSKDEARETIMAKLVGRWRSGIPITIAPTYAEAQSLAASWTDIPAIQLKASKQRSPEDVTRLAAYDRLITDFRYWNDADGTRCPASAHIRRTNPRDALDPLVGSQGSGSDSALTNRRRILRRGLPYGDSSIPDDASEHGVIFMVLCASLFGQFEFVQQQWLHYGGSFNIGNDTDPIVGLRRPGAKAVIPGDLKRNVAPFICANIPRFVETRGGEYFFLPSLTALREIAEGSVDPT